MRKPVAYLIELLKNPTGSMTVEFIAFAPVLIAALVVSFEFGRAFWAYDVVSRDLRAAVRYLSRTSAYSSTTKTQAENVARTGTPNGTTLHFPWTNSTCANPTRQRFVYAEQDITSGYNDAVKVVTMTANVPIALSLQDVINRVLSLGADDVSLATTYCLSVSYQARYIGN